MTVALWDSLPASTNPQEAQHFKLYKALGKNHPLLPGLEGVMKFMEHYELLASAEKHGVPVRYGQPEDWKDKAEAFGTTKS
ncbi:hypothetical protein B0H17DRAFT_1196345 [Mycena rosella]|uniref:Uncharacterized protein n=1 Tax=Mycena rosella TaxID=1033263 RepID=A0AAD7DTB8_MYCRO|nr:hypothetical protein B0H17DRAFT_1196345 [Mycena rosella]